MANQATLKRSGTGTWLGPLAAGMLGTILVGLLVRQHLSSDHGSTIERAAATSHLSVPDMRRIMSLMDKCELQKSVTDSEWSELVADYNQNSNTALKTYAFDSIAFLRGSAHSVEREKIARQQLNASQSSMRFYAIMILHDVKAKDWQEQAKTVYPVVRTAYQQMITDWLQGARS